jgi:hypothetical protein
MDIKPFIIKNINIAARRTDVKLVEDSEIKPATSPYLNLNYEPGEEQDQAFILAFYAFIKRSLGFGRDACLEEILGSGKGREIIRRFRRVLSALKNLPTSADFRVEAMRISIAHQLEQAHKDLKQSFPCWKEEYMSEAYKAINEYDKIHNPDRFNEFFNTALQVILAGEGVVLAPLTPSALNVKIAEKLAELHPSEPEYIGLLGYTTMINDAVNAELLRWIDMIFSLTSLITALGALMIAFNGGVAAAVAALAAIVRAAQSLSDFVEQLIRQGLLPSA